MEELGIPNVSNELGQAKKSLTKIQFEAAVRLFGEKRALELVEEYGIEG